MPDLSAFTITTQRRRAVRSPRSSHYPTLPTGSVPYCNGSRLVPYGSPAPTVAVRVEGQRVVVDYDAPNLYCRDAGEWPPQFTCANDVNAASFKLQLFLNGQPDPVRLAWIYYDYGTWDTGEEVPCGGSGTYTATITYPVQSAGGVGCDPPDPARHCGSNQQTLTATPPCATPDRGACPAGGGGKGAASTAGQPINIGSGDVATALELFTLQQSPLPLAFTLTYHSSPSAYPSITVPTPLGTGWTHPYNQYLTPIPGTNRLLHLTADGREFEYTQSGSVWNASRPAELRGTVSLVPDGANCPTPTNQCYLLTDLDGGKTFFDYGGTNAGRWRRTEDRWGNKLAGGYTGTKLTTVTDSIGRSLSLTYDSDVIETISVPETPTARAWTFSYNTGKTLLLGIKDPLHTGTNWRSLAYDGSNRLSSIADDASKTLEGHTYWADGRGKESYSEGGSRNYVLVEYDQPLPGQRRVTHRIDASSTLDQVSYFNLVYQGGRWLPVEIDGPCSTCGGATSDLQSYTYTSDNHVASVTDGSGIRTTFTYNADGNTTGMTEAAGTTLERTTNWEYAYTPWPNFWTSVGVPSTSTGSRATARALSGTNESTLTVTESGYSSGSSKSYVTTHTFDPSHRLLSVDGPRPATEVSDVTSYTYFPDTPVGNDAGRLSSTTDAVGFATTHAGYDVFGTPLSTTDPNGVLTTLAADAKGRVTGRSVAPVTGDPDQTTYTTTYRFDSRDRLDLVTFPNGNKSAYVYEDGTNRLTQTILEDSASHQLERLLLTLNDIGGKKQEEAQECSVAPTTDCSASWATRRSGKFVYDSKNRLTEIRHPVPLPADSSRIIYAYDANGLVASVRDERHSTPNTTYTYDALRRLRQVTQTLSSAPGGQIQTTYGYDVQDNLTSVTDPNLNQTTYVYDDYHRLTSEVSPVSGATTSTYDGAGNLVDRTDANVALTHRTYDAANRLLAATSSRSGFATELVTNTWGDSSAPRYGKGRLLAAEVDVGGVTRVATTYGYERRGLVAAETQNVGGTVATATYAYDANGNRRTITYPSGRVLTYTFDFADRPLTATSSTPTARTYVSSATYYPFGPDKTLAFGNGTTRSTEYDERYRPAALSLSGVTPAVSYSYGEDALGNVTSITDNATAAYTRTFGYDDLNRLTSATTGAGGTPPLWGTTGSFTYDSIGNRDTMHLGTRNVSYAYELVLGHKTPRLTSVTEGSQSPVTHDLAGNELTFGAVGSTYSSRGLLVSTGTTSYLHDARGVRVSELTPATGDSLYTIAPCRVFDTRDPDGPYGGPALGAGQSRAFTIWGTCGIGSNASAIAFNVAAVAPLAAGYLTLFPSDVGQPTTSTLNLREGRTRSNNGLVRLSGTGQLSVFNGASQSTHALLDVTGYFVTNATAARNFTYTPELSLLAETNVSVTSPTPLVDYVWFGGRPIAQETVGDPSGLRYTLADHLGTPFLQTDGSAAVTWRAEYEPFGSVYAMRTGSVTDQPLRLPGQEQRATSAGRYYNVFRWYRPDIGQYTQPDPYSNPFALKEGTYTYVAGNPMRLVDPLGLAPCGPCCQTDAQRNADRQQLLKAVNLALFTYSSSHMHVPQTQCETYAAIVGSALAKAKRHCFDWNDVFSQEKSWLGIFSPYYNEAAHVATVLRPCDKADWKDGTILDAWPSGVLHEYPWDQWRPRTRMYTPTVYDPGGGGRGMCPLRP